VLLTHSHPLFSSMHRVVFIGASPYHLVLDQKELLVIASSLPSPLLVGFFSSSASSRLFPNPFLSPSLLDLTLYARLAEVFSTKGAYFQLKKGPFPHPPTSARLTSSNFLPLFFSNPPPSLIIWPQPIFPGFPFVLPKPTRLFFSAQREYPNPTSLETPLHLPRKFEPM